MVWRWSDVERYWIEFIARNSIESYLKLFRLVVLKFRVALAPVLATWLSRVPHARRDLHHSQPNRKEKFYKEFFSYILFSNQLLLQSGNHHPWRLFFFRFLFSFGLHIGFSFSESLELSSLWQSPSAVDCAVEVDTGGGGDSTVTCLDVSSCGGVQTTWIGLLNKANSYCSVIHLQDWYW